MTASLMWLDSLETITLDELSCACGLSLSQLQELVDYAALTPLSRSAPAIESADFWVPPSGLLFSAACVVPLRTACALQADYDLDLFTVGVLIGYLHRIDSLERQVQSLRAQLPLHHTAPAPR